MSNDQEQTVNTQVEQFESIKQMLDSTLQHFPHFSKLSTLEKVEFLLNRYIRQTIL